ncbi:MAG: hypothetical protein HY537_11450 [Deltaproteobacteria bacterium]|nr:hypothetical protein [Deltaproteobacteria bacterium]
MSTRSKLRLVLFIALGILVVGCGKDEKKAPEQGQPPAPSPIPEIQPQKEPVTFIKNISANLASFKDEIYQEHKINSNLHCFQVVKRNEDGKEILQISLKNFADPNWKPFVCPDTLADGKSVKAEFYLEEKNGGEVYLKGKDGKKSYGMYLKSDPANNGLDSMQHLCSVAMNFNQTCEIISSETGGMIVGFSSPTAK